MGDRKGSLMQWQGECGHWFVVYSLEPAPEVCPDCAEKRAAKENASRKVLADIVDALDFGDLDDVPGEEGLDEWLADWGVIDPEIRKDIATLAMHADSVRADRDHATHVGRELLKKHPEKIVPKPERLVMP